MTPAGYRELADTWAARAETFFDENDDESVAAAQAAAAIGRCYALLALVGPATPPPATHRRERLVGGWGAVGIATGLSAFMVASVFLLYYAGWLVFGR